MGLGGVLLESAGCGLEGGAACLDGAALGGLPAFFLAAAAAEAFGGVASGVAEGSAEGCGGSGRISGAGSSPGGRSRLPHRQ